MIRAKCRMVKLGQSICIMLCAFFCVLSLHARTSVAQVTSPISLNSRHNKLGEVYNAVASTPFQHLNNEVDKYGERALRLNGDARIYALWRILYAYKDDQNTDKFDAWHNRILVQAQTDNDAKLDVLARFMRQAYQNETNGFTTLSEREWSAYMAMSDPAIRNIVELERVRQLLHFSQWADAIDVSDKLIVRLEAAGNDAAPVLSSAHQAMIFALMAVGDYETSTDHMLAIAKLLNESSFFSQKMDILYNLSMWSVKENDLAFSQKFQNLYSYYIEKYNIQDLRPWNEFLCAMVEDANSDNRKVIKCLENSSIKSGSVSNFLDYTKLQFLTRAYVRLGDVAKAKFYLNKIRAVPDDLNPHDELFEKGIEAYLLKAEGRDDQAFDALGDLMHLQSQRDEALRIASVRSMYKALRQELDSKTAESRLLVKQVQMGRMLLAAAVAIAIMFAVIVLGGVLWVIRMRRMQSRLSDARAHAEAANAAKSRFLAVMSHELRTPLNGVLGMAQALKKEPLPPEQAEQVNILVDSGQTLMVLLNDVLDMSRIEAGRVELAPTPSNMKDMLERVVHTYRNLTDGKPVDLIYDIRSSALMPMRFDILRVYQCLSNLVSNAIKFTESGEVRLVASADHRPDGYLVRVEVRDSGVGMSQATLDKLFEAYSQADATTARTHGGSGLGLNISRRLAELMGGGLTVTSEEGKGSVFVMTFLAGEVALETLPEPAPAATHAVEAQPDDSPNINILLVDDHPVNRKVARLFLEPFGYTVTEAVDGQEALDMDMSRFDLVLMDINMPRLDGLEATRRYRAGEAVGRHLPIVALTADAMQEQIEACYAAGMDAHIAKPIIMDTLIETVARLLSEAQTDAKTRAVS
ncbi:MAG: ATP-binding protein [Asticcacaulis sp.]|uniref:ATP-binding protein n=1 Tax=Asticcacaulis sp. TaxID=1872648 RepID=UPI003F7C660B